MKRLFAIAMATLIAACAYARADESQKESLGPGTHTFHIASMRWGAAVLGQYSWGREKAVDFNIIFDVDNGVITIDNPDKKQEYKIIDEHNSVFEKKDARYGGISYCYEDECGARHRVYFRGKLGEIRQIMFFNNGSIWCYSLG